MYYINYHTGAGDDTADTMDKAMQVADAGAAYTQQDITIEDEAGNVVAIRRWYGVQYNKDEDDAETPICFGDFGYYADWCRL